MGRKTVEEEERLAAERLQQAIACKYKHKLQDAPKVLAPCALLGNRYGVGVGLYFWCIKFIRWLLFWLAICTVPFAIVINTSRFTTADHKGDGSGPGMSVLPAFSIFQSLTFAVMPDDEVDQGLLSWMNIQLPGFEGVFTMPRKSFLIWISMMDAGSMAVFSLACLVLYRLAERFSKAVDAATKEVADYTVVIKGLPETTPIDIGHHFSKHGRVMDVVMVKDFGPLLNLAATATNLEQQRKAEATKVLTGKKAAKRNKKIKKTEKKMAAFMEQANQKLEGAGFGLKAVFVTFDKESQAEACLAANPQGWFASLFQRKRDRFLGKYRYWAEPAQPPEDYIYENLSVPRLSRYLRMALVRLVVLCILLACAGAVTKLMAMNMEAARSVVWDNAAMDSMISIRMRYTPLNATEAAMAPIAGNATLARIAAAVRDPAAQALAASAYLKISYCSVNLENVCSLGFSRLLNASVAMRATERATWGDLTDSLLKREAFLTQLAACSRPGSGCTHLAACYPCHCSMLSKVAQAKVADRDWVLAMRQECGGFIATLDMKSYVMKGLISGVIVMLNLVLKAILQFLVEWEKHWTQSDKERAYAVLAFVSQLMNSVLVLLLVNAQSSTASAVINKALSSGSNSKYTQWGSGLILSGAYTDFSPSWFVDVGQSLQLLIIINAVVTAAYTLAMWIKRKLHQYSMTSCFKGASQAAYNSAWIGMEFVLDARVSDMMLGISIILMFGTGIPSLYLWGLIWLAVVELTDRWSLARVCQIPARYGKSLPFLLLGILPWAAATHLAFGLWMHTRFNAGYMGGDQITGFASSAGAGVQALSNTVYFRRISQANGLPLLVLLIVHLTVHVFIRFSLYFFGKAFTAMCGCCCKESHTSTLYEEVTYEAALLARHAQSDNSGAGHSAFADVTVALAGAPTYRLPHHPRYSEIFHNPLYKPVWFKAFGRLRYTTLLSRPGGGFIIAPEPILDHDQTDMEQSLSTMSGNLQKMALKMADDSGLEGSGKRKRHSGLLTEELQAMRERSMSVQVAVLAGLDSPRASFSGPNTTRPSSANFGAPLSPRASLVAAVGSGAAGPLMPGALAAGAVAGAVAASGGSFSMFAPPGTPGRSRFSCAPESPAYGAVGADLLAGGASTDPRSSPSLLCMDGQQLAAQQGWPGLSGGEAGGAAPYPQAWTVGANGYSVPLVPVILPAGGIAYYPADSLPAGAVVAAPEQAGNAAVAAAAAQGDGSGLTLSGGMAPAFVEGQLSQLGHEGSQQPAAVLPDHMQEQQQRQAWMQPDAGFAAAGADAGAGIAATSGDVQQQAHLQSRAEAIFGQAAPAQELSAEAGCPRPNDVFALSLPLPPSFLAVPEQQGAAATAGSEPSAETSNSAQQDTLAAAAAAGAGNWSMAAAEPGWMGDIAPGHAFSLWEGVMASAREQGAPEPRSPQHSAAGQEQQLYPSMHAASTPHAVAAPDATSGAAAAPIFPSIHLSLGEAPAAYPNVHLTTVESPAGFATAAVADAQAAGSFSAALLGGRHVATAAGACSPFKTDAELGLAPVLEQSEQQPCMQPPPQGQAEACAWPVWGVGSVRAPPTSAEAVLVQVAHAEPPSSEAASGCWPPAPAAEAVAALCPGQLASGAELVGTAAAPAACAQPVQPQKHGKKAKKHKKDAHDDSSSSSGSESSSSDEEECGNESPRGLVGGGQAAAVGTAVGGEAAAASSKGSGGGKKKKQKKGKKGKNKGRKA